MVVTLPNGSHLVKWEFVIHLAKFLDHLIKWFNQLIKWLNFTNWPQHLHQMQRVLILCCTLKIYIESTKILES